MNRGLLLVCAALLASTLPACGPNTDDEPLPDTTIVDTPATLPPVDTLAPFDSTSIDTTGDSVAANAAGPTGSGIVTNVATRTPAVDTAAAGTRRPGTTPEVGASVRRAAEQKTSETRR